ncbi:hypothetical protein HUU05_18640 [candidate division KSB1 bacterium]|nr:hypothetical protein [candidate division KSB1 bacterium]
MPVDLFQPLTNPITKETFRTISVNAEAYVFEWIVAPGVRFGICFGACGQFFLLPRHAVALEKVVQEIYGRGEGVKRSSVC